MWRIIKDTSNNSVVLNCYVHGTSNPITKSIHIKKEVSGRARLILTSHGITYFNFVIGPTRIKEYLNVLWGSIIGKKVDGHYYFHGYDIQFTIKNINSMDEYYNITFEKGTLYIEFIFEKDMMISFHEILKNYQENLKLEIFDL